MPQAPTDLPSLQYWISNSAPYHNVNHARASFIDVNDFTTYELEAALCYAIQVNQEKQAELETARDEATSHASRAAMVSDTLLPLREKSLTDQVHASKVLDWAASGLIAQIPSSDLQQIVISAKFADDLTYQNCVVGLAVGIRKLKDEIANLKQQNAKVTGDEDDWFLVGKDEAEQREQDKLYAEIEIQLDGALARGAHRAEEGDIEVMFTGP